jgi:murein DD-endopeptidase MepM/ murein hydrolase activator NlpD
MRAGRYGLAAALVVVGLFFAAIAGIGALFGAGLSKMQQAGQFAAVMTPALATSSSRGSTCLAAAQTVSNGPQVGVYGPQQTAIAAVIVATGASMGVSTYGQAIGVAVGMGESGLSNSNEGDAAGPSSRGVFQQQDNGAWGSYEDRMNPGIATANFFRALLSVPGWESMTPTQAAHATQHNQDPNYYTAFWPDAVRVTAAVSGLPVESVTATTSCTADTTADPAAGGYALPLPRSALTAEYVSKGHHDHPGADLPAPAGTPIYSIEAGTVIAAGPMSGYGDNFVAVRDSAGFSCYYGHGNSHTVSVGQQVAAGDQVATVGTQGFSTGNHLHLGCNSPGQSVPTTEPSLCPQPILIALYSGEAPPPISALLTTGCISGHLASE